MPDPKIVLEGGNYNWESGRGYQAPAEAPYGTQGGVPEGWGGEPEVVPRDLPSRAPRPIVEPPADEQPPEPELPPGLEAMLAQAAGDAIAAAGIPPAERVNLDSGTAVFRGHTINLSADAIQAIQLVLAAEVCRELDEEKNRVLSTMQYEGLQTASGGGQDLPEMPGPSVEMVEEKQGDAGDLP